MDDTRVHDDSEALDAHYAGLERLPDHELIRRDAAAHPERGYREHVEAARRIAAKSYREDLKRISPAAWDELHRELEAEDLGL